MTREKSCGTIIVEDNKVLMIVSPKNVIGFPKGHVEKDETEIETAIRETKEETNLDVIVDGKKRFSTSYTVGHDVCKEVVYFIAGIDKNKQVNLVAQKGEVSDILWVDINRVEEKLQFNDVKTLWKEVLKVIR